MHPESKTSGKTGHPTKVALAGAPRMHGKPVLIVPSGLVDVMREFYGTSVIVLPNTVIPKEETDVST